MKMVFLEGAIFFCKEGGGSHAKEASSSQEKDGFLKGHSWRFSLKEHVLQKDMAFLPQTKSRDAL